MRALQRFSLVTLLIGVWLSVPADVAADQKGRAPMTDGQIKAKVEHKLSGLDLASSNLTVGVHNGVVMLSGMVPSLWLKQEAIERARKTDDVTSVVSELSVTKAESDDILANEIATRVRQYAFYTIYDDITGRVHDGLVTLTGKVTSPHKASEIADRVAKVYGVREVDNQIETLPMSTFDDQLRYAIARRIYRDALFSNYAIQANPPIHIVVDRGHVTLAGAVNSEVERRMAEVFARSAFGVFSVKNKLRLDSEMSSSR
jgi:hyperosmotically inducible periplasmic protein